jgi:outer membrane protein TolC
MATRYHFEQTLLATLVASLGLTLGGGPLAAQSDGTGGDEGETSEPAPELPSAEIDGAEEAPVLSRGEAIEIAVEQNHDIQIQQVRTDIAERNVSLGNADYLPNIDGVVGQDHLFGGPGYFGNRQIYTQTRLGVELNWPLFLGFRRPATYSRLKELRRIERLRREVEIEGTLVDVTTAYADVLRQRRLVGALQQTRELSEQRVDIAETRLDAGTGTRVDLNLARVELNRDRSAVSEQEIALVEAKTQLNRTLGRSADESFRVEGEIEVAEGLDYEETRETALEANRRLQVQRREVDVSEREIEEVQSERWPNVNLSLGYNYTGFHSGIAPDFDTEPGLEYGVNVRIPLFQGFNVNRRVDNAQSRRTISAREVRSEETRIRAEIRDAYEAYERHLDRIELARKSVDLAEENAEIGLTELRAGRITQVELRQVQLNLLDARTRLINARYDAKVAELRLRRLAGRLYDQLL